MPPTVNERLQDRAVLRAVRLERFENGQVKKALDFLETKVYPDVERKLQARLRRIAGAGDDTGPVTTKRLRALDEWIAKTTDEGYRQLYRNLKEDLVPLTQQQVAWQRNLIADVLPVQFVTEVPTLSTLSAIVTSKPMEGRLLRQWSKSLGVSMRQQITTELNIGLAQGETVQQLTRRVRGLKGKKGTGVFGKNRRAAEGIVRTAVNHTSNHSLHELYKQNQDLIKQAQWLATLDNRTCLECGGLDGEAWDIDTNYPRPPAHHQCRCIIVPVLRSWKELGINLKEAPAGTRASMNGQVGERLTYKGWFRKQPAAVQNDIVGPARGRAFRRGDISIDGFTGSGGRILSLEELGLAP